MFHEVNPSRGEYNRICSTGQPLTGRTLPYILHGSTPLGEENMASVQRNNLLKRIQFRCCFLGATLLRGEYRHGLLLETTLKRGKCMLRRLSGASPQTRGTCGMYTLSDAPPFRCTPSGDMNPYICRRDTPHIARNTKWTPAHLPRWDHPRVCREDTKHP